MSTRSWWGRGTTDRALFDDECVALAALLPGLPDRPRPVPRWEDVSLPAGPRSPTTTPSDATTGRATTGSDPCRSPVALRAAKSALDPAGILDPGVLIGPV